MTIKRILAREFPESPSPTPAHRKPVIPWTQFLDMHLETTLGCDFFYKRVWSWRGPLQVAVLTFIHLGSRRVYLSPPTLSPNDAWIQQQIRNVAMWCQDEGIEPRFLIRDNDQIFARTSFDYAWKQVGERVLRTPFHAPNGNSYTENWIGNLKRECLNHFFCVSLTQLDRICQAYREFHNQYRPHQGKGIGNRVLDKNFQPQAKGEVRCRALLGDLLKHYYRDSA